MASIAIIHNVDTWQLVINTATTIITFLLAVLLQNSESRLNTAVLQQLNAVATALLDSVQPFEKILVRMIKQCVMRATKSPTRSVWNDEKVPDRPFFAAM